MGWEGGGENLEDTSEKDNLDRINGISKIILPPGTKTPRISFYQFLIIDGGYEFVPYFL